MTETASATLVSLRARDFRNFDRLELELPAEGLVLVGDNGHGKTNFLEAISYLALMRSVRGARDADVARFGSEGFFLEGSVRTPIDREIAIGFDRARRAKRVKLDGSAVERLSDALGALPSVLFSPGDIELIAGAPGARRRYLDVMLALSSRGYLHALQRYRAALERRNAVLRDAQRAGAPNKDFRAAEVWEAPMVEHGAVLVRARRSWVKRAAPRFAEHCTAIGESGQASIRYETNVDVNAESVEQNFAESLAARRATDVKLGATQIGPHRDDLALALSGRALREFGSAGQQRTAAIALRALEAETIRESLQLAPVFLLDDPLAELDSRRGERVLRLLREAGLGQTVLTVPRDSDIPRPLTNLPRRRIVAGMISEVG